jgi:hypothetical protein
MPLTPAFFFPVYDDTHLCTRLISEIRRVYPAADVIAVSDGAIADRQRFKRVCDRSGVIFIETQQRLKVPDYGALWLQRLFEHALARSRAEVLIRTEGDTRLHRGFDGFPDGDVAGTLSEQSPKFPRGGCVMWQRAALKRVVGSGLLGDSKYKDRFYSYTRYGKWRHEGEKEDWTPILCSDRVVADVIQRLSLKLSEWEEVNILFRGIPETAGYAATHPHR